MSKFVFICNDTLSGLDYEVIHLPSIAGRFHGDVINVSQYTDTEQEDFLPECDQYLNFETVH